MPHRNLIMSLLLAVAMFPLISLMVPLFKVMRELGLLNTYLALILPYAVLSLPVCTLVMASFFQDIPPDLEAAAMVDGCSRVGALFHVVIPLSAPGVFTAAILAFVNAWDEFLLALTMMNRVIDAHAVGGHHALPGRVRVPVAAHLGGADHRHRADLHPHRRVPGARRGRIDERRRQGLKMAVFAPSGVMAMSETPQFQRQLVRQFRQILLWPLQLMPLKEGAQIQEYWDLLATSGADDHGTSCATSSAAIRSNSSNVITASS